MGTGTETGTEARTVAEMGTGTTIPGTRTDSGRADGRRKSARNREIVVDAVRETGETTGGKRRKCRKERVGSVSASQDNLESNNEVGGGAQGAQGSSKNLQVEKVCPLCGVGSEVIVTSIIDPPLGGSMRVA